jgi:hypothetical protein
MARGEVVPCAVVIDELLPSDIVEMSSTIFKRARVSEGDQVVISGRSDRTKAGSRLGEDLTSCEIAMGPKMAIFLGIMEGDEVKVGGSVTIGGVDPSQVESFTDVLGQHQDRLEPLMGDDLDHFRGLTVQQVLDHLVRHGNDYAGKYLVVAPNPEGKGIPTGELCEDPSLHVKIWDPSEK